MSTVNPLRERIETPAIEHVWRWWWLIGLSICAVHIWTISFDSRINQDEVQIVDFGRAALQPDIPWAMSWNIQQQIPVLLPSYLGPVFQELAFRLTAPSDAGVILSSLLGAFVASTCLLGWLRARQVPGLISLALALAFFLDPAFSTTYRNGRVDGWAMAAILLACWSLRYAEKPKMNETHRKWLVFLAGVSSATAVFFWPTALILWPLVVLEYIPLTQSISRSRRESWLSTQTPYMGWFMVGGVLAASLLLIPVLIDWDLYLEGLRTHGLIQQRASVIQPSVLDMLAVHDPIIAISALLSLAIRRELGVLLALSVAVLLTLQTMIYPARLVYLLPYAMVIIGAAAQVAWNGESLAFGKPLLKRLLVVLLAWNAAVVLAIRPFISFQQQPSRDPLELISEFERVIGRGEHRVLVGEWAPYFAGRALDWQIYREGSPVDSYRYEQFLLTMDFILVAEMPLYSTLSDLLHSEKFEFLERIQFRSSPAKSLDMAAFDLHIPESGYKTILVYRPVK